MPLADTIRMRRTELNLSQRDLALKAGVSQQLIAALESGTVRSTKFLHEIAVALGTTIADLEPKFGITVPDAAAADPGRYEELPVFGADDHGDGIMTVSLAPVDFINRPAPLEYVRGAYGLIVVSEQMTPEFELGDVVLVNPHLPPVPQSSCIFYAIDKDRTNSRLRRLLKVTRSEWQVKAWNPPPGAEAEAILPRDIWSKCHRIVGRYNRR
jgi:transcriptional regulator with XRE-family HTH domain